MKRGEQLEKLLSDMVAIPSVNAMGRGGREAISSSGMVDFLETWFRQWRIDCDRQAAGDGEENLIARVTGRHPGRTIVFDAHTDTVPAEDWLDEAFSPQIEGGRLVGRGACDAKGALAAMMWALASAAESGEVDDTIVLLASADEEYNRRGVRAFLVAGAEADGVVVGEPTSCRPIIACKGAARWEIIVRGRSAHTSVPDRGVNAIARAAEIINRLVAIDRRLRTARRHPLVSPPTLTVSIITGGEAVNMVPAMCRLTVDLRTLPDEDPATAMRDVQARLEQRLSFELEYDGVQLWPGAETQREHAFVQHCLTSVADVGAVSEPGGVEFGCHASDYAARGIPSVVLGPGSIDHAHQPGEFVEIDELIRAAEIYRRMMTTPAPQGS